MGNSSNLLQFPKQQSSVKILMY